MDFDEADPYPDPYMNPDLTLESDSDPGEDFDRDAPEALGWVCYRGTLADVQRMVEQFGLTPADARANRNVALRMACRRGHFEMAQWLADTFHLTAEDARDYNNYALRVVCEDGNLDIARWLVDTFHLTAEDARTGYHSPLLRACVMCRLEMVQWLVSTFDLTAEDIRAEDNAALKHACGTLLGMGGGLALAAWLIDRFHLTMADGGASIMVRACETDKTDVVELLVDRFGLTADDIRAGGLLAAACSSRWSIRIAEWLVDTFHLTADDARDIDTAALPAASALWLHTRFSVGAAETGQTEPDPIKPV